MRLHKLHSINSSASIWQSREYELLSKETGVFLISFSHIYTYTELFPSAV